MWELAGAVLRCPASVGAALSRRPKIVRLSPGMKRFSQEVVKDEAAFSTNQARRGGDHNFTTDGCCAGRCLAFRRAVGRALACDPRRSTGHAKGSGVPRRDVSA